jgi:dihydropteroate synthase
MGIVNVTPDSFSDGGRFLDPAAAIAHGLRLAEAGADILDVGGESTRPGARPVAAEDELARVRPVIEGLAAALRAGAAPRIAPAQADSAGAGRATGTQISIDTRKAEVARVALESGASIVNDVSALRADPAMAVVVADAGAGCCLMHMRGEPETMQAHAHYEDVVGEVRGFLAERLRFALEHGIARERIMLDPGIGFAKTAEHNLELLRRLDEIAGLGAPVLVGTSRKSFLGRIAAAARDGEEPAGERLAGTIATNVLAFERGASVFRVHDVAPVREALAVAAATLGGRWTARSAGKTPTS